MIRLPRGGPPPLASPRALAGLRIVGLLAVERAPRAVADGSRLLGCAPCELLLLTRGEARANSCDGATGRVLASVLEKAHMPILCSGGHQRNATTAPLKTRVDLSIVSSSEVFVNEIVLERLNSLVGLLVGRDIREIEAHDGSPDGANKLLKIIELFSAKRGRQGVNRPM